uniref:Pleckstrin homology domain containing, family G (with RhoGef domain) member 7 n=1 Tax=Erpetoichthys calabaricus TaxID=27687 RepID=A0A8C4S0Z8_ERPCA
MQPGVDGEADACGSAFSATSLNASHSESDASDLFTSTGTQTSPVDFEDEETQTHITMPNKWDYNSVVSKLRNSQSFEPDEGAKLFYQFDRQAPARISTSPTLRRMRKSTRRPLLNLDLLGTERTNNVQEDTNDSSSKSNGPEDVSECGTTAIENQNSPQAKTQNSLNCSDSTVQEAPMWQGNSDKFMKTSTSSQMSSKKENISPGQRLNADEGDHLKVLDPIPKRLQERRRSSFVVSLPGLDVSPGDLFVTDGVADLWNHSRLSDSKKSKRPVTKRSTSKERLKLLSDVEKNLSSIRLHDWRSCEFQNYKDKALSEFVQMEHPDILIEECPSGSKRHEAVWELFTSECVYFLDQLMVLKEVFLSTLTTLQSGECLLDVDTWRLFANVKDLCLVSFGFMSSLLWAIRDTWRKSELKTTVTLRNVLIKHFKESVCLCLQTYCLNYSSAVFYLDTLKQREDFTTYLKWCERNEQCKRLQLADLLVTPMQRFTRYPLLLKNIAKKCSSEEDRKSLQSVVDLVEGSIEDLDGKVKWLDSFHKVQQLQGLLIWTPVWECDKRPFIPDSLKHLVKQSSLENVVSSNRNLLYEGRLVLVESTKLRDVCVLLFDVFILITKVKRSKKKSVGSELGTLRLQTNQELQTLFKEGCTLTVLDQPLSLDRVAVKSVDQLNASACGLRNAFMIMHHNRYQQCIGVFLLQAQSESIKKTWMTEIEKAATMLSSSEAWKSSDSKTFSWIESSQI